MVASREEKNIKFTQTQNTNFLVSGGGPLNYVTEDTEMLHLTSVSILHIHVISLNIKFLESPVPPCTVRVAMVTSVTGI